MGERWRYLDIRRHAPLPPWISHELAMGNFVGPSQRHEICYLPHGVAHGSLTGVHGESWGSPGFMVVAMAMVRTEAIQQKGGDFRDVLSLAQPEFELVRRRVTHANMCK